MKTLENLNTGTQVKLEVQEMKNCYRAQYIHPMWGKKTFTLKKVLWGVELQAPTHAIVKGMDGGVNELFYFKNGNVSPFNKESALAVAK